MKRLFMIAPALFCSLVLHAAAVGLVMWTDKGHVVSTASNDVWLGELPVVSKSRRITARPTKRVIVPNHVSLAAASAVSPAEEVDPSLSESESSEETASEIFDLTSRQTHPYFSRLSKILSEVKRGLSSYEGHLEQFSIQIGIEDTGQVLGVRISGDESRLKRELTERMARLGFLPALPKDVFLGKDKIEIRYRVLFPYN